jgi:hypothetical protein
MSPSTHLYNALNLYLRQCSDKWRDVRHIQMMIGMIQSEKVHPSGFGVYVKSRARKAQSKQRRFRRGLSNRRINLAGVHQQFQYQTADGQWHKIADIRLKAGQAHYTGAVQLGKTKPYGNVYLAFAQDKQSGEFWLIVSDEPTSHQTFAQYKLRFQVEENFLDLKANGFQLEACRIREIFALTQLLWVVSLTMLFLVLQGTVVVAQGQRQTVDPHWQRGMSYLKIGWNSIRLAITEQTIIPLSRFLSSAIDPERALASR